MLPAQTYVKGFLRTYADFLGLDGQLYVDEYNSRYVADGFDDMPQRRPHVRQERAFERKVVVLALAGIAALTALVIVAWKFGGGDSGTPAVVDAAATKPRAVASVLRHRGVGTGTYVEIWKRPWVGSPDWNGTLVRGEHQKFLGKRFWICVARPDRRPVRAERQSRLAARAPKSARAGDAVKTAEACVAEVYVGRPRAVVVVTGSELVRGERTDLNGPFLAREALRLGLEPARIAIVGDAPEELEATLRAALAEADAVLVSGGLGPTHDDRTVELVAKALGVGTHVEPELATQIEGVSRAAAERMKRDYADFAPGVLKQATVPDGAISLGLAGTAPGLLVPRDGGRVVVVLPGPPGELQRLWPNTLETDAFLALLARTQAPGAASCGSSASASRPSRAPSRRRAATGTASR